MIMNQIQIFKNSEFGAIRTLSNEQGQPMFCAKDVCDALGYTKARNAIAQHVDEGDALKQGVIDSLGRLQQTTFINESGLYALVLSSKLESAHRFKHWVTSEVLPSIRQQGGYLVARPTDDEDTLLTRALQLVQTAFQKRDHQMALLKQRADYTDQVLNSISCLTTTQIAKELNMTGHELNRLLCMHKIQYRQSGQYLLYARYARMELAQSRTLCIRFSNGRVKTFHYLVWTEQGRYFIHQLLHQLAC